jgi:four helix bundle protein
MNPTPFKKYFDLEQRMLRFAKNIRAFARKLPKSAANTEDSRQLIRSSGSIGANYIEANEAFSKKDFVLKIRTSKRESKESSFWLELVDTQGFDFLEKERKTHAKECDELTKILGSIVAKCKEKRLTA